MPNLITFKCLRFHRLREEEEGCTHCEDCFILASLRVKRNAAAVRVSAPPFTPLTAAEGLTVFFPFFFFFPPPWFSQRPSLHSHNSKTCYNPILVGEYLALLSQQYGIWVILLNMNGPFTRLNGVAWQWPFFPSLLHTQNNIQRSSLGTFPRNQQKRNSKLSLKPSKH